MVNPQSKNQIRRIDYVAQQSDPIAKHKPKEVKEPVQPDVFQEKKGPFTLNPDPPSNVGYDITLRTTPRIVAN